MSPSQTTSLQRMLARVSGGRTEDLEGFLQQRAAAASPAPSAGLEGRSGGGAGPQIQPRRRVNPAALEADLALEGLNNILNDKAVAGEEQFALEAIVMPYYRPVVDVIGDYIQTSQITTKWSHLAEAQQKASIQRWVRSVGRINVPGLSSIPYAGTGFVVGENLLMTNRHVAQIFASGVGERRIDFTTDPNPAFDFYHEIDQPTSQVLTVERVAMIHPWWDMALLKVSNLPADRPALELSIAAPETLLDREVVVIGYPGYDDRLDHEFQQVQNRIFRGNYYVKRFQPGTLLSRGTYKRRDTVREIVTHDCSTLGGNSGSAVIDVRTGQVVGLHFGGLYLVENWAVSTFDLAQDPRVVNAGVKFAAPVQPRADFYGKLWSEIEVQ